MTVGEQSESLRIVDASYLDTLAAATAEADFNGALSSRVHANDIQRPGPEDAAPKRWEVRAAEEPKQDVDDAAQDLMAQIRKNVAYQAAIAKGGARIRKPQRGPEPTLTRQPSTPWDQPSTTSNQLSMP